MYPLCYIITSAKTEFLLVRFNRTSNVAIRMADLDLQRLRMAATLARMNQSEFVRSALKIAVNEKLALLADSSPLPAQALPEKPQPSRKRSRAGNEE